MNIPRGKITPCFVVCFLLKNWRDFAASYVRLPEGKHVFVVPSKWEDLEPGGTLFLLVPVEHSDCRFALKGRFQRVDLIWKCFFLTFFHICVSSFRSNIF